MHRFSRIAVGACRIPRGSVDDRRLQTESFEAAHQGFWRLLENAGERPEILGADGEDLAVEVPTPHLDHADVTLEDGGLGALALVEAHEVDADLSGRGARAVTVAAGLLGGRTGQRL